MDWLRDCHSSSDGQDISLGESLQAFSAVAFNASSPTMEKLRYVNMRLVRRSQYVALKKDTLTNSGEVSLFKL